MYAATGVTSRDVHAPHRDRVAVPHGGQGRRRQPPRRREDLPDDAAAGHPGGTVLVDHPLRQRDALDAPDAAALPAGRQPVLPDPGGDRERRRLDHGHVRSGATRRQPGGQLDPDRRRARAGSRSCASTARSRRSSTSPGARARSSSSTSSTRPSSSTSKTPLQTEGSTMSASADDTPVLDLLASMTADSVAVSSLDPQSLMLVRLAALVAVDAPTASYLLNLGPAADAGVDADQVRGVLTAVAPIVGTARVVVRDGHDRRRARRRDRGRRGRRAAVAEDARSVMSEGVARRSPRRPGW